MVLWLGPDCVFRVQGVKQVRFEICPQKVAKSKLNGNLYGQGLWQPAIEPEGSFLIN